MFFAESAACNTITPETHKLRAQIGISLAKNVTQFSKGRSEKSRVKVLMLILLKGH